MRTSFAIVALFVGTTMAQLGIANDPLIRQEDISEWVDAAEKLEAAGSDGNAIIIYQQVLKSCPQNSTVLAKMGRLHYQLGNFAAAAGHWSRAAQFEPDSASHHNSAGYAYWKMKKYRIGLEHLERAVELDPKSLRYANNLATMFVDIGEDAQAITTLGDAHHNRASVHFNMAYLYSKRQRNVEALAHVEMALSHDPNLVRAIDLRDELKGR